MKTKVISLIIGLMILGSASLFAQYSKDESFKVDGKCMMCRKRIKKSLKPLDGVTFTEWNKKTKIIKLSFDPSKTKIVEIHEAIAKAGHDTELHKADDEAYNSIPKCCRYRQKE